MPKLSLRAHRAAELAFEKMRDDPIFFIESALHIVDRSGKSRRLILNRPQAMYYARRTRYDLIAKARKEGFSTLIAALWLHACIFRRNQCAVTLAQRAEEMIPHRNRIQYFLDNLGNPEIRLKIEVSKSSAKEIYFPSSNSYYWIGSAGATSGFGRSRDISHFHGTEVAHYPSDDSLLSALNACTDDAYRVLESTGNGVGEPFEQLCMQANDPQSGSPWRLHFFPWFVDPRNRIEPPESFRQNQRERDLCSTHNLTRAQIYWYHLKEAEQADKVKFRQEYPSTLKECFIASGRNCFDGEMLQIMLSRAREPMFRGELQKIAERVIPVESGSGCFFQYSPRDKNREYLISADVAEGLDNGCWSVATVFDRESCNVVGEWRGRINPGEFGRIMVKMGEYYNYALLAPERNNHGHATLEAIRAADYTNIFRPKMVWPDVSDNGYGFQTNERTKALIENSLALWIKDLAYFEPSKVAILEMMAATRDNSNKMVSTGYLDTVISRAIGLYLLQHLKIESYYRESKEADRAIVSQRVAGYGGERNVHSVKRIYG